MFKLDPQLERDTIALASLPLCELLLMNDSNYPWIILVPRRAGLRELVELADDDQQQYLIESNAIATLLQTQFAAYKLNIASLGNMVEQLHIHHIARFKEDVAWPKPVWGALPADAYAKAELSEVVDKIRLALAADFPITL